MKFLKRISIYSLTIGVGLGIIITSIFNILWIQTKTNNYENENKEVINESINEHRIGKEIVDSLTKNMITTENNEKGLNSINEDIDGTDENSVQEVFISKGMQSEAIAQLLESKDIIKSKEEFNSLAAKLGVTKKFQYGLKIIPRHSSLEEIILILTKK